jgi:uncharacterized membrane protein YdbT with pleckstrin-like domain
VKCAVRRDSLAAVEPEPGEQIFFHGHPSWRSMLGFYLKGVLAAAAAGAIAGAVTAIANSSVNVAIVIAAVLVVYALVLLVGFVRRVQTTYSITDQRLTIDTGLLSREVHETRLARVQNVNSTQSVLERMLRIGTLDFDTSATAEFDFKFRGVADPHKMARIVDGAIRQNEGDAQIAQGE